MWQLSTIHTGNSKTDIQNACVLAHAGLHVPDALHGIGYVEQAFQQLKVLADIDNDLTRAQIPEPISDALFATMTSQHVAITGTLQAKLGVAIATTEDALLKREHQHAIKTKDLQLLDEIPQTRILPSMPRIGLKTAAQILMTVGDMSDFLTAGHLASYAGLSPQTSQSGTTIMTNSLNRAGNKKLKTPCGNRLLQ